MSETMNVREQAKRNAEVLERVQTLRAMERLMVNLGGKNSYIKWLEALPEDASLTSIGVIGQEALREIAEDDGEYKKVLQAFAAHMGPVLLGLAEA